MEKEFVPYEQALALKELGFDELCLARFDGGGFRLLPVYDPLKNSEIKESWFCITPLYQQAFRWFRDKHNLTSEVSIEQYRRNTDKKWMFSVTWLNKDAMYDHSKTTFKSYEEAELACLDKLIEIVENK
jgi:hypothetical protein